MLATRNSAAFIEQQLVSLQANECRFTLHWLDDHSVDDTRDRVAALASRLGISLRAWHQPNRLGVPGAFFRLLECVSADIYLFCDHDDIWQRGKIDATVADLLPDVGRPTLCYSEPWVFSDENPQIMRRYFEFRGIRATDAQDASRAFALNPAVGNTVGLTRPLRELYLAHREIANNYAAMHDWWMHLLALATGVSRMLGDVPTTLYRQHDGNVLGIGLAGKKKAFALVWDKLQSNRRIIARQATGFTLLASRLKSGPAVPKLMGIADLVKSFDRRQSPGQMLALLRQNALQLPKRRAIWTAAIALFSDATPPAAKSARET